ncbi:hypothetical protein DID76_00740 [Candidatus Marinamargulisbacteria bacterium SCGC AG-414-C22]|nr:hypothetical protein DID76_00740 [Candidatus Marinamargulisbacteria bacterium SCGC AG-414-C22]
MELLDNIGFLFLNQTGQRKIILFDVHIETIIKTGYFILPAASRLKDIGAGPDASFSLSTNNDYVNKNIKSFVGTSSFEIKDYTFVKNFLFIGVKTAFIFHGCTTLHMLYLGLSDKHFL